MQNKNVQYGNVQKWKIMNLKKFVLKIVIILMTIKLEDFDLDNILIDEKPLTNILIYDISYKTLIVYNLCLLDSII